MLNLDSLNVAETLPQITAKVEFTDIRATPYFMTDDQTGRVNSGLSIPFEGGKFSCPIDPEAGKILGERFQGVQLSFSKIVMLVSPTAIGRDKKGALKPIKVLQLFQGKEAIYSYDAK